MSLSCKKIVENLQKGGKTRDECIGTIYKQFLHLVGRFSKKYKLLYELVINEYVDSILVLDTYVRDGRFEFLKSSKNPCLNFILKTLKNKCKNLARKEGRRNTIKLGDVAAFLEATTETPDSALMYEDLLDAFNDLDEKCKKILMDWLSGYKMEEIAERNDLSNKNAARVSKSRCLKKLKEILRNKGY